MTNKTLIFFIIASLIGAYFFFKPSVLDEQVYDDLDDEISLPVLVVENSQVDSKKKKIEVIKNKNILKATPTLQPIKEKKSIKEINKLNKKSKIEQKWRVGIRQYFIDVLNLTPEDYEDYLELREEYKKDRELSYKRYIQKMQDQYGNDYKNNPEAINEVFINENYKDFISSLSVIIGSENINEYFIFKSEYNDSVEEMIDDDEDEFLIEY